jgi:hypothetical protein
VINDDDDDDFFTGAKYSPKFSSGEHSVPVNVEMTGTGDFIRCRKNVNCKSLSLLLLFLFFQVRKLFDKRTQCWVKDCTFDGVYQPKAENVTFVASSNFADLYE